jgi:hypothetical protein
MKINFSIILVLPLFLVFGFTNRQSISDYEYELNLLVNEFKEGVSNEDEFEELVINLMSLKMISKVLMNKKILLNLRSCIKNPKLSHH